MMAISLPGMAAMMALAASAAVGVHGNGAQDVDLLRGEETLPEAEYMEFDVLEDLMSSDWKVYQGIPVVGTLTMQSPALNGPHELCVGAYHSTDRRDVNSLFASTIETKHGKEVVILNDPEAGGLLMQLVENRSHSAAGKTDGWYLAAHKYYAADSLYPGYVRLIAHRDRNKAAVFELVDHNDSKVLRVKENRDGSGKGTVGYYLSIPPNSKRDNISHFVAFGPEVDNACSVSFEAA